MGKLWNAFKQSLSREGLTGAKTAEGHKAWIWRTEYEMGAELKISGFILSKVVKDSGLNTQQVIAALANIKFQRYFDAKGYVEIYNQEGRSESSRSYLLARQLKLWMLSINVTPADIPSRASYQAANPDEKDAKEVKDAGGTQEWVNKAGGEAKNYNLDLPGLPDFPKFPSFGNIKMPSLGIAKYVFLLIIIIIGLIALGYSGVGGILGREHERKRGKGKGKGNTD